MSSDNFHVVLQLRDGSWRASRNHSMSWWQEKVERAEYRAAASSTRSTDPNFATRDEALAFCEHEYSEYGTFTFERPDALNA